MYKQHPDTGEWIGRNHEDRNWFLPKWHVVAFDETEYWTDNYVELFGQAYGVYMIDVNRHVHICSFSPSYEAYFLRNEFARGHHVYIDYFRELQEQGVNVYNLSHKMENEIAEVEMIGEWVSYFNACSIDIDAMVEREQAVNICPFESLDEWKDFVMTDVRRFDYDGKSHGHACSREPGESYDDFVDRIRDEMYENVREGLFDFEIGNPSWLKGLFREADTDIQYSLDEIRALL